MIAQLIRNSNLWVLFQKKRIHINGQLRHNGSQFITMSVVIIGKCLTLGVNGLADEKLHDALAHQNGQMTTI